MTSSQDAIKRVVEAFERSDWSEIDVRSGDLRVHLATAAPTGATVANASVATDRSATEGADDEPAAGEPDPTVRSAASSPPAGAHVVVSPSPGILWRSPEPGRPPFADVGHTVEASTTVCIIEVMKLMSHLKAGVSGEVVAVYGEDGVAVQKGQALFAIAPSGSTP